MAEHLARSMIHDTSIELVGAGTMTTDGRPATEGARIVMAELGIDMSGHRSRDLWSMDLGDAVVFTLAGDHLDEVRRRRPDVEAHMLDPTGASIADPYGADIAAYRTTRERVRKAVAARFGGAIS
jgi:protein-tyrosine phosphatase